MSALVTILAGMAIYFGCMALLFAPFLVHAFYPAFIWRRAMLTMLGLSAALEALHQATVEYSQQLAEFEDEFEVLSQELRDYLEHGK